MLSAIMRYTIVLCSKNNKNLCENNMSNNTLNNKIELQRKYQR